ncbi:hypothetical protein T12_520 [Trichinella patagoniensis]|uniref:Uncharacterized protein n=1 Tax=Trichinella patagoniensis TaxID=990121 RepID=A0A0V0Z8E0_9BILA|nr:hypothetical protein T12_520 [Trichinella patagoniensis]
MIINNLSAVMGVDVTFHNNVVLKANVKHLSTFINTLKKIPKIPALQVSFENKQRKIYEFRCTKFNSLH